jgi:hypothetical protein
MGSIATVNPEYAEVLFDYLGFEITDELKKKLGSKHVELSILLDNKVLSPDQKAEFSNTSPYVIAYDGTDNYHLCIGYVEEDAKGKLIEKVESLAKITKIAKEQTERKLNKLNDDLKQKEKLKKIFEGEISKLEPERDGLRDEISKLQKEKENAEKSLNLKNEQYEKLVDKIERLRKNFLVRVLFRIYQLELD